MFAVKFCGSGRTIYLCGVRHAFEANYKEHQTLPSEFRVSVIALRWIVRPVFKNESHFMAVHLVVVCGIRELQEDFFSGGGVSPLLSGQVFFYELTVVTSQALE